MIYRRNRRRSSSAGRGGRGGSRGGRGEESFQEIVQALGRRRGGGRRRARGRRGVVEAEAAIATGTAAAAVLGTVVSASRWPRKQDADALMMNGCGIMRLIVRRDGLDEPDEVLVDASRFDMAPSPRPASEHRGGRRGTTARSSGRGFELLGLTQKA